MKVPFIAAVIGLLLGIGLTVFLEVETPDGTALLVVICTLMAAILGSVLQFLLNRRARL